jgi:hypothetical protein
VAIRNRRRGFGLLSGTTWLLGVLWIARSGFIDADPAEAMTTADDGDPTGWKAAREFIGMWRDARACAGISPSEDHDRIR